jgi:hypothetical protein
MLNVDENLKPPANIYEPYGADFLVSFDSSWVKIIHIGNIEIGATLGFPRRCQFDGTKKHIRHAKCEVRQLVFDRFLLKFFP